MIHTFFTSISNSTDSESELCGDEKKDLPSNYSFEKAAETTYKVIVVNPQNTIPVGKDLPRLMAKMTVNNQKIDTSDSIQNRLKDIVLLFYRSIVSKEMKENNSQIEQQIVNVFNECEAKQAENHEWIQHTLIQILTENHPVFQTLRGCNQSAIAQAVIYIKGVVASIANKEFRDKEWFISVDVSNSQEDCDTIQTVTVTHNRGERVDIKNEDELLQWFIFRWQVIFTFQRKFATDQAVTEEEIPLEFIGFKLSYTGSEEYNNEVVVPEEDIESFSSSSKIDAFMNHLFDKYTREIDYKNEKTIVPSS
jgi:hypothetical protein